MLGGAEWWCGFFENYRKSKNGGSVSFITSQPFFSRILILLLVDVVFICCVYFLGIYCFRVTFGLGYYKSVVCSIALCKMVCFVFYKRMLVDWRLWMIVNVKIWLKFRYKM